MAYEHFAITKMVADVKEMSKLQVMEYSNVYRTPVVAVRSQLPTV